MNKVRFERASFFNKPMPQIGHRGWFILTGVRGREMERTGRRQLLCSDINLVIKCFGSIYCVDLHFDDMETRFPAYRYIWNIISYVRLQGWVSSVSARRVLIVIDDYRVRTKVRFVSSWCWTGSMTATATVRGCHNCKLLSLQLLFTVAAVSKDFFYRHWWLSGSYQSPLHQFLVLNRINGGHCHSSRLSQLQNFVAAITVHRCSCKQRFFNRHWWLPGSYQSPLR